MGDIDGAYFGSKFRQSVKLFHLPSQNFQHVDSNLPPRLILSLLLLIQPLDFHLLQNPICAQHHDDNRFSILDQGLSPFHLFALEATFIKAFNPALCRQKQFLYSLKIMH